MSLCNTSGGVVHITASWTPIDYRIVYSANGGAGEPPVDSNIYHVGDKIELKPITGLEGTWGNKIILGWSHDPTSSTPIAIDTFVEALAEKANIANTVTIYAIWAEGSYKVTVNIGDSIPNMIPAGWSLVEKGKYSRDAAYGTSVKEILADWDTVALSLEDHVFKSWSYNLATVLTNVDVIAEFEPVSKNLIYILAGSVVVIGIIAFAFTRLERW